MLLVEPLVYNNKVIHTFVNSGTFVTPEVLVKLLNILSLLVARVPIIILSIEVGGGGAGGLRTGTTPIGNSVTYTITIGHMA